MEAGRELDALIDEKVMGYPAFHPSVLKILGTHLIDDEGKCPICGKWAMNDLECLPHYSNSIAAAWEVVEKIRSQKHACMMETESNRVEFIKFEEYPEDSPFRTPVMGGGAAYGKSIPHAICLAALKAVNAI